MESNMQHSMDHAWKYFEIHAQQRISVFNFYLATTGLVAAGIGVCLQQGGGFSLLASGLSIFLTFVSFLFWKLDQRVSLLIKRSERALAEIEKSIKNDKLNLFTEDSSDTQLSNGVFSVWSYGRCFRISFCVIGITSFLCALLMLTFQLTSK
jgi:hypothetical protein